MGRDKRKRGRKTGREKKKQALERSRRRRSAISVFPANK